MADPSAQVTLGFAGECYLHRASGLFVISSVEVADGLGGGLRVPQYHLSISHATMRGPARCTSGDAMWVLAAFDMSEGEEDNHVQSGIVRNFWRPVADHLVGLQCECKDTEPAIKEDKGDFVWRGVTR
jgi:hypothetical protein